MEEFNLVPSEQGTKNFDEEICGIRIEKSKRRKSNKKRFKKFIILAFSICLCIIVAKNFGYITYLLSSLFEGPAVDVSSSSTDNSLTSQDTNTNDEVVEKEENIAYNFAFIDTSPANTTVFSQCEIDVDTSNLFFELPKASELYDKFGADAPIVLITCFSPLECYSVGEGYSYTSAFYDSEKNVADIGKQICQSLNDFGINSIFLQLECTEETLYDYQSRCKEYINNTLKDNPSIAYIFDISRSLTINNDMSMNRELIEINGQKIPTISINCGTSNGKTTEMQQKGIFLSNELASSINADNFYFVSKISYSDTELNQAFCIPCIQVDIGSYACSYEGALSSADYFSIFVSNYLNG